MRYLRYCCLLLTLLPGCNVPDVRPFTVATASMSTALSASLQQVAADLDRATILPAPAGASPTDSARTSQQRAQLDTCKRQLRRATAQFGPVAHAFDAYAKALEVVAATQATRSQAIAHVFAVTKSLVKASQAFVSPLAALAPALTTAATGLDSAVQDLAAARTNATLRKLASAEQDTVLQRTAHVLRAALAEYARLDAAAYTLLSNNLPASYTATERYYQAAQQRQAAATTLLASLVAAETSVQAGQYGNLSDPEAKQGPLDAIIQLDLDPQRTVAQAFANFQRHARSAVARARLFEALRQREAFYRALTELPQAQYDAEQARRTALVRQPQQHSTELLQKSGQLLAAWASAHHELRRALGQARPPQRQDLATYAQVVQQLATDLQNARK